jgi:hypothetical protein
MLPVRLEQLDEPAVPEQRIGVLGGRTRAARRRPWRPWNTPAVCSRDAAPEPAHWLLLC